MVKANPKKRRNMRSTLGRDAHASIAGISIFGFSPVHEYLRHI